MLLVYAWVSHCGSSADHLLVWMSGSSSHRGDVEVLAAVVIVKLFNCGWSVLPPPPQTPNYLRGRHLSSTTVLTSILLPCQHFVRWQHSKSDMLNDYSCRQQQQAPVLDSSAHIHRQPTNQSKSIHHQHIRPQARSKNAFKLLYLPRATLDQMTTAMKKRRS